MMPYRTAKTLDSQRGAELVEFIITLPLILAVAFIMIELAVAITDQAVLTNASRAAAREVIQGGTDADAKAAAALVFPSMISWTKDSATPVVTVTPDDAGRPSGSTRDITVTVVYDFDFLLLPAFLTGAFDIDLTARTVMRDLSL